jgi:hypothetical protein
MEESILEFNIYQIYFPEHKKTTYVLEKLSSEGKQFDWKEKGYSSLFELADKIKELNPNLSKPIYFKNIRKNNFPFSLQKEKNTIIHEQPFPLEKQKTLADLLYNKLK